MTPTPDAPTPAAIYVRISRDAELDGLGVERQRQDCAILAAAKGWHVVEVYTDNDVSASTGKLRPAYERMKREVEAGRVRGVVVWDVDRLTRSPRELEDVIDWAERHGLALASVGGDIDLSSPQGRMTARIKGTVARHEVEQSSRRIRRKRQEIAEAGRYVGPRPYGWTFTPDKGLEIQPDEAAVVHEAYRRLLAGESIRAIIYDFNTRGTTTGRGNKWQAANFRAMVLRWTNCAVLYHRGKEVGPGDWPPLVSREDHERVVALLTDPTRRSSNRGTEVKYLLTGLIRCAACDGPMQGARAYTQQVSSTLADGTLQRSTRRHPDRYRCATHGCRRVTRLMTDLDTYISERVIVLLEREGVQVLGGDTAAADAARERVEALEAKLSITADQFADDLLTADQLSRITARLRPQLEAARADLARAMPSGEAFAEFAGSSARAAWEATSLERRRAVIRVLIDAGLVIRIKGVGRNRGPGGGPVPFDARTVEIYWGATQ